MTSSASSVSSADVLLFVYSDPGAVPAAEFNDWYDNEHGPARLTVPGISAGYRLQALDGLAAWYTEEPIRMLLAVPGWRRARGYRLTSGTAPAYLSLHELASAAVFEEPAYRAAVSTPWMKRIVDSAIERERRVFGLHKSFG